MEIRSPSDGLPALEDKMQEYVDNGTKLGWLIDPLKRTVYVYRPGAEVERLDGPKTLSADPLLPNCKLDLEKLWP